MDKNLGSWFSFFDSTPSDDPSLYDSSSTGSDQSDYEKANAQLDNLLTLQEQVDQGLNNMPAGPAKDALLAQRDDNRGFFNSTILPAWQKIKDYFSGTSTTSDPTMSGEFNQPEVVYIQSQDGMGFLPLLIGAGIIIGGIALTTLLTYLVSSSEKERAILNDPSFTAAQKQALLSSDSSLTTTLKSSSALIGVAIVAFLIFQYAPRKRKLA